MITFQIWQRTTTDTILHNTTTFISAPLRSGYANVYEYIFILVVPHQQVQRGGFLGYRYHHCQ